MLFLLGEHFFQWLFGEWCEISPSAELVPCSERGGEVCLAGMESCQQGTQHGSVVVPPGNSKIHTEYRSFHMRVFLNHIQMKI